MHIHAIADLHLSLHAPKEMDIFGPQWKDHFARIRSDWTSRVAGDDVVLIPGDISWATHLADARIDLEAIGELPGRKILLRGNHDYWWNSPTKVRGVLLPGTDLIQNNALIVDNYVICGSRGWLFPMGRSLAPDDEKIFEREKIRLHLSLDEASRIADGRTIIAMMHYPPLYENWPRTDFTDLLEEHGVRRVVFGHLHGAVLQQVHLRAFESRGVIYDLVSADYLDFALRTIV